MSKATLSAFLIGIVQPTIAQLLEGAKNLTDAPTPAPTFAPTPASDDHLSAGEITAIIIGVLGTLGVVAALASAGTNCRLRKTTKTITVDKDGNQVTVETDQIGSEAGSLALADLANNTAKGIVGIATVTTKLTTFDPIKNTGSNSPNAPNYGTTSITSSTTLFNAEEIAAMAADIENGEQDGNPLFTSGTQVAEAQAALDLKKMLLVQLVKNHHVDSATSPHSTYAAEASHAPAILEMPKIGDVVHPEHGDHLV